MTALVVTLYLVKLSNNFIYIYYKIMPKL